MKSRTYFTLTLILFAFPVWATEHTPPLVFSEVGFELSENWKDKIQQGSDFLIHQYMNEFGFTFDRKFKLKLKIFKKYYDYKLYQLANSRTKSDIAFYSTRRNEAVLLYKTDSASFISHAFHEINHVLMRNIHIKNTDDFRKRPFWLNEGLSEYFENMVLYANTQIEIKPQKIKNERCIEWLYSNEMIDLQEYFKRTHKELKEHDKKEHQYQSRTIAWSLVYYLMHTKEGKSTITNILSYTKKHQYDINCTTTAIDLFYQGGVKQLEKDWQTWLIEDRYAHFYHFSNSDKSTSEMARQNNIGK